MCQSTERVLAVKPRLSCFPLFIEPTDWSSLATASPIDPVPLSLETFTEVTTKEPARRKKKPINGGTPINEKIVIAKVKANIMAFKFISYLID